MTSANQAIGKIRTYNIVFYTMKLFVVLIGWICLRYTLPVASIMWAYVIVEFLTSLLRLPLMKHIANIDILQFCKNVFIRIIIPCITIILSCYLSISYIEITWRIVITMGLSIICGSVAIWATALTINEKQFIKQAISNIIKRTK